MNRNTLPAWIGFLLAGLASAQTPPVADSVERPLAAAAGSTWSGHVFHSLGTPYPVPFFEYYGQTLAGVVAYTPSFWGMQGRVAAGGFLYLPFRPGTREGFGSSRPSVFRIESDERWLRFPFDLLSWSASAQAGWFRWRTNPDGLMLGEYLARMNAYPPVEIRSGKIWDRLDSLTTLVSGFRFGAESPGKAFRHEVLALFDGEPKQFDVSYAYSGQAEILPGIEAGIGAMRQNMPFYRSGDYAIITPSRDTTGFIDTLSAGNRDTVYFSKVATLFSASAAVDAVRILTGKARADRGGRIHAEAAVLGWRNYPSLYDDRGRRTIVTAGIHLPAFGLLDAFRLQVERTPWMLLSDPYTSFFRPTYGSWVASQRTLPTHYWYGQAYLSRTWWRRLQLQSMLFLELGGEGGEQLRPGEAATYVGGRALLYELRLSWLF